MRLTWLWPLGQIPVCIWHCFVAVCVCSSGVGTLVSSAFNRSRIRAFLPVPSLALDGVSSCQRLAGNRGTSFLTASSHDACRSVCSVAWVLWPNSAQLCQKLEGSELKPLGPGLPFVFSLSAACAVFTVTMQREHFRGSVPVQCRVLHSDAGSPCQGMGPEHWCGMVASSPY